MHTTRKLTTANQRRANHIRARLAIQPKRAGKDDWRGDKAGKHGKCMLQSTSGGQEQWKLSMEGVERREAAARLRAQCGERGHAKPEVVVVAEPAFAGGELLLVAQRLFAQAFLSRGRCDAARRGRRGWLGLLFGYGVIRGHC